MSLLMARSSRDDGLAGEGHGKPGRRDNARKVASVVLVDEVEAENLLVELEGDLRVFDADHWT